MSRALVTGGARGLGAAIARHLSVEGIPVVVHYRSSRAEAEALQKECGGLEIIQGDFSTPESTREFVCHYLNRFGNIKFLVNNVGNYLIGPSLETQDEQWRSLFQTNFHAPVLITSALFPLILKEKGAVLNIGTAGLGKCASCYSTAYNASKEALLHYTRSLAKEALGSSVRVNMLSPGYLENSIDRPKDPSQIVTFAAAADAALFLLRSPSITGQNLEIASGVRL